MKNKNINFLRIILLCSCIISCELELIQPPHSQTNTFIKSYEINGEGKDVIECNDGSFSISVLKQFNTSQYETSVFFVNENGENFSSLVLKDTSYISELKLHDLSNGNLITTIDIDNMDRSGIDVAFVRFNKSGNQVPIINEGYFLGNVSGSDTIKTVLIGDTFLDEKNDLLITGFLGFSFTHIGILFGKNNATTGSTIEFPKIIEPANCYSNFCIGSSILLSSSKNIVILAKNNFGEDDLLIKLDQNYELIQSTPLVAESDICYTDMVENNNGNIVLVGTENCETGGRIIIHNYNIASGSLNEGYPVTLESTDKYLNPSVKQAPDQSIIILSYEMGDNFDGFVNLKKFDLQKKEETFSKKLTSQLIVKDYLNFEITRDEGLIIMANDNSGKIHLIKTDLDGNI